MEHIDDGGDLSFSGSGDGCSAASDESGWTTYIDYFMETEQQQEHRQQQAITVTATDDIELSRSSSSGDDDEAQSTLPELAKPSEGSGRLSMRKEGRRRKKKQLVIYDESLEDTATSPISSPMLIDSRDSHDKHKNREDECDEISDIAKKTTDEFDSSDKHTIT